MEIEFIIYKPRFPGFEVTIAGMHKSSETMGVVTGSLYWKLVSQLKDLKVQNYIGNYRGWDFTHSIITLKLMLGYL